MTKTKKAENKAVEVNKKNLLTEHDVFVLLNVMGGQLKDDASIKEYNELLKRTVTLDQVMQVIGASVGRLQESQSKLIQDVNVISRVLDDKKLITKEDTEKAQKEVDEELKKFIKDYQAKVKELQAEKEKKEAKGAK